MCYGFLITDVHTYTFFFVNKYIIYTAILRPYWVWVKCLYCAGIEPATSSVVGEYSYRMYERYNLKEFAVEPLIYMFILICLYMDKIRRPINRSNLCWKHLDLGNETPLTSLQVGEFSICCRNQQPVLISIWNYFLV
jgi:hypothetical protein